MRRSEDIDSLACEQSAERCENRVGENGFLPLQGKDMLVSCRVAEWQTEW